MCVYIYIQELYIYIHIYTAPEDGLHSPKRVEHPKIKTSYKNLCILLVHLRTGFPVSLIILFFTQKIIIFQFKVFICQPTLLRPLDSARRCLVPIPVRILLRLGYDRFLPDPLRSQFEALRSHLLTASLNTTALSANRNALFFIYFPFCAE